MSKTTWRPHDEHGKLSTDDKKELPDSAYAFPKKRKEPMTHDLGRKPHTENSSK